MLNRKKVGWGGLLLAASAACAPFLGANPSFETLVDPQGHTVTVASGHPSLQKWLLPETPPSPADNLLTPERAALGKMLFFDPRLSGTGRSTCASCHVPERGWSDGMPKSVRFMGGIMTRASPTIVNIGYNSIQLWDGRSPTLEHQALNGMSPTGSMNAGPDKPGVGYSNIEKNRGYQQAFERAYPGEGITPKSLAKALASFERSVISRESPFDRWVAGDSGAMSAQQVEGFRVFIDQKKANCSVCHAPPNFTDNGFHNIGLKSFEGEKPDLGRFQQRPVAVMKGAFKTPTLRDIDLTAPYFHDGSARSLTQVVEHYARGGDAKTNLSPEMKALTLTAAEKEALVAFLQGLTTPHEMFEYPLLPKN